MLKQVITHRGLSIKNVRSQVGCSVQTFADKERWEIFRWHPHFMAQKPSDYSKFMMYPYGKGVESVQTFCGLTFRDFARTFLWTTPRT